MVYGMALVELLPDGPDKTWVIRNHRTTAMWANVKWSSLGRADSASGFGLSPSTANCSTSRRGRSRRGSNRGFSTAGCGHEQEARSCRCEKHQIVVG